MHRHIEYNTDSEIIKHICIGLMPKVLKKYKLTKEELKIIKEAKSILLSIAKKINDNG